jgi:WD40 repeat protein
MRGHEHVIESIAFICEAAKTSLSNIDQAVLQTTPIIRKVVLRPTNSWTQQDRTWPAVEESRSVRLWNIASQTCLHKFQMHENWVRSVLIHPSGNYILAAGDDRSIRVLDVASHRCLRHLENAHPHLLHASPCTQRYLYLCREALIQRPSAGCWINNRGETRSRSICCCSAHRLVLVFVRCKSNW